MALSFLLSFVIPLLASVAYYRFRVQTEGLFYAIFPIFAQVAVDQPIRFNHIHHKEVAKLNCTFCHRYVERNRLQEFLISNSVRPAIQAMQSARGRRH